MKFKGTLIITDPCYITKDNDYERTNYGSELNKLGFTTYLVADTGFGDWSNHITKDDGTILGEFCADSGQVCVVLKEDLDKYNPLFFSKYRAYSHCYAIVDNFEGEVEIDTSNSNWTIVHGQGNIDFSSDTFDEDDEDEWNENEE